MNGEESYQPRISVVVPVYNGRATIGLCIESLLKQTYPAAEIIIVDNNSTDGTAEVIEKYPVTLLYERALQTSYAARNRGIMHASGDIVALTDADCAPDPDWLSELVAPFADTAVGAALGAVEDSPPSTTVEEFTARVRPFAHSDQHGLKSLITANTAMRRASLIAVGLFDESLPTAGDVDLGWRMQLIGGVTVVDRPTAKVQHKHRSRFKGVFGQYRRYGLSEILLATLYRGGAGSTPPTEQAQRMARQALALGGYGVSFLMHLLKAPLHHFDRAYLLWPVFLVVVESGSLLGKLDGLIATRGFRRNPFPAQRVIAR